jgi:hypothetical protein
MKACLAHNPKRQIFFITLLFSCITFVCNAQWTFTETVIQNGKCIPYPRAPQVPYYTQSACETARQWELSNSGQDYSMLGDGSCTTIITCTPCIGSEINTTIQTTVPGQASAGEVSFDGQFEGKALYSPHESSAFEDWSKDYRQQLESYGITSILGNTLTAPNIPLTGDRDFDIFYIGQTASFNPTTPARISKGIDASVVDLTGKTGMVGLLTSAEEQAKRDNWYEEKGFNTLSPITAAAGIEESKPAEKDFKESSLRFALEQLPIVGTVAGGMLNVVDVVLGEDGLPKAVEQATKMDYQGAANTADNMQAGVKTAVANTMLETIINSFVDPIKGAMNSGIIAAFKVGEKGEKAVGIVTGGAELYQSWKKKN